jgi:hypothetical protein
VSFRLWWRWNDGASGHVWLAEDDLERLRGEMALQGMARLADRIAAVAPGEEATVPPQEVTLALDGAQAAPLTLLDADLWRDWLVFLEGAEAKGGILVRR